MRLKKALSICSVLAIAASMTAGMQISASAATQVGDTYNYTGTENSASANDNSKISPYLDVKWTIPTSGTRGIMTKQNTKINDGETDDGGDFGKCFTGAQNHYSFRAGLDAKIVYYTFDLMADGGGFGSVAINGHRLDGKSYNVNGTSYAGVKISNATNVKYNPHKIIVIADTLNNKAYYYSTAQTGEKGTADITLGSEASQLDVGNRYDNNNNRYFFKNFEYGTIDYAVNGSDTITAGDSAAYTINETGTALGVGFTPANMTLALASAVEGVTLANGTLTVADTVADNTTVTINANINGTTVASKTVTVSAPAAPKPSATAEKIGSTTGKDNSVADVFYGTYTSNGNTTVNTIKITVNNVVKTLSTTNLSGDGEVSFGVVISYKNGVSQNYVPTFTFE